MNNDGLKSFISNVGVLCETWTVIYTKFKAQGMNDKDALMHTQSFMGALISSTGQNNGGKNEMS